MSNPATGHRIAFIRYAVETIECSCSALIQAEPDLDNRDRHLPLTEAWAAHKRASGVPPRQGGRDYRKVVPA